MSTITARWPGPSTTPTRTPTTCESEDSWSTMPPSLRTARWRTRKRFWWRRTPSSRSSKSILRSWCMAQNVDPLVHRCQLLHQSEFWKRWSCYCSRSWWSFISKQSVYQPNTTLSYSYMMYKRKCLVKLDQERDRKTKNEEEPKWYQYRPCTNSYVKISIVNICWKKKCPDQTREPI